MCTYLQLILLGISIAFNGAAGYVHAESQDNPYKYTNCAGVSSSLPLLACEVMQVDLSRDEIILRDNIEKIDGKNFDYSENGLKFVYIDSSIIPLAIPRKNYDGMKEWVVNKRRYVKIRANNLLPIVGKQQLDTVVVLDNRTSIGAVDSNNPNSNPRLFGNAILTFLYSPVRGVVAIGFPNGSNGSGGGAAEVTFCAAERCLFDEKFMKSH